MVSILSQIADVTERIQLQKKLENYSRKLEDLVELRTRQLREKNRLAAIGETAGMVGHDIRNPLQAIVSDLYLIKTEVDQIPEKTHIKPVLESIQAIDENIYYINKIVSDLQDYTRPLKPNYEEINLKEHLKNILKSSKVPQNIEAKVNAEKNII
jgi:signal transduction histidine kinase